MCPCIVDIKCNDDLNPSLHQQTASVTPFRKLQRKQRCYKIIVTLKKLWIYTITRIIPLFCCTFVLIYIYCNESNDNNYIFIKLYRYREITPVYAYIYRAIYLYRKNELLSLLSFQFAFFVRHP